LSPSIKNIQFLIKCWRPGTRTSRCTCTLGSSRFRRQGWVRSTRDRGDYH